MQQKITAAMLLPEQAAALIIERGPGATNIRRIYRTEACEVAQITTYEIR